MSCQILAFLLMIPFICHEDAMLDEHRHSVGAAELQVIRFKGTQPPSLQPPSRLPCMVKNVTKNSPLLITTPLPASMLRLKKKPPSRTRSSMRTLIYPQTSDIHEGNKAIVSHAGSRGRNWFCGSDTAFRQKNSTNGKLFGSHQYLLIYLFAGSRGRNWFPKKKFNQ